MTYNQYLQAVKLFRLKSELENEIAYLNNSSETPNCFIDLINIEKGTNMTIDVYKTCKELIKRDLTNQLDSVIAQINAL